VGKEGEECGNRNLRDVRNEMLREEENCVEGFTGRKRVWELRVGSDLTGQLVLALKKLENSA